MGSWDGMPKSLPRHPKMSWPATVVLVYGWGRAGGASRGRRRNGTEALDKDRRTCLSVPSQTATMPP